MHKIQDIVRPCKAAVSKHCLSTIMIMNCLSCVLMHQHWPTYNPRTCTSRTETKFRNKRMKTIETPHIRYQISGCKMSMEWNAIHGTVLTHPIFDVQ